MSITTASAFAGHQAVIGLAPVPIVTFLVARRTHSHIRSPDSIATASQLAGIGAHVFVHAIGIIAGLKALSARF